MGKKRQKDKPEDIDWGEGKKKAPVSLFGDEPEPEEQPRRKKISLKKTQEDSKIKVDVDEGLLARLKKPVKVEIPEIPPEEPVEEEIVAPEEAATVEAALPSFLPPEEKKKKGPVNLFGDDEPVEELPKRKSLKKVEDEPVIKIEKKNALADRAAMLKKKKEEEEKKEQEEAEKIDLRKNLSRRKSSAGAAPEEDKELTEGELAAKKAKEAQLAKEQEKLAEMEASIKAAEEAMLAAAAKKKDQGDLGFDQLAAMDAAAEAELKAQQEELAAKKTELEAKKKAVSQGFAAPTGGEAVDLKALKGGMKKAAPKEVNLFGDAPEPEEAEGVGMKKRLKKKKPEEDIKIAVDTSVQDAMKARLAGLKKKDEKEEEPAEEVGPSEEELKKQEHDAARLAAEKANMDKLQADIKAAEEAFLKSQTARQGADIIAEALSGGAEALGELDAM